MALMPLIASRLVSSSIAFLDSLSVSFRQLSLGSRRASPALLVQGVLDWSSQASGLTFPMSKAAILSNRRKASLASAQLTATTRILHLADFFDEKCFCSRVVEEPSPGD